MSSHIGVRSAVGSDLPVVADIMTYYVENTVTTFAETPSTARDWAERHGDLTTRGLPFLVAESSDGAVVGFAYAAPWRPQAAYRASVEDSVYLAPGATGRGVGTALLSRLITLAAHAGCRQMLAVIADAGDPASVLLHRKLGFRHVGTLGSVGRKHGRDIDTHLMQRDLISAPPDPHPDQRRPRRRRRC